MTQKILYLPLEIFGRELGAAVLLSDAAIAAGWSVVMGAKSKVFSRLSAFDSAPGVFFLKSIVPGEVSIQKKIRGRGHKLVSLDIEGLVPTEGTAGVTLRFSDESLELADMVFFYGQHYLKRVAKLYPRHAERLKNSGAPAIDEIIQRASLASSTREKKRDRSIVIATSCVISNSLMGPNHPRRMMANALASNGSHHDRAALERQMDQDAEILSMWSTLIPKLANSFPTTTIILRPHPTESLDYWYELTASLANVRIDRSDSIMETLLKADVFMHFNSTSATAAFLMDVPIIMPMTDDLKSYSEWLTFVKELSHTPSSDDMIVHFVSRALQGDLDAPSNSLSVLEAHCNIRREGNSSSEEIIQSLEELVTSAGNKVVICRRDLREITKQFYKDVRATLRWRWFTLRKRFFNHVDPELENAKAYATKKQPTIAASAITRLYSEITGVPASFTVEKISDNIFILRAAHDAKGIQDREL